MRGTDVGPIPPGARVHDRATLFGLSTSDAKACLSTNARAVLYHAGTSGGRFACGSAPAKTLTVLRLTVLRLTLRTFATVVEMRRNTYRGAVAIPPPLEPAAPAKADKTKRPQKAPAAPPAAAPPAKRARPAAEPAIVGLADPDPHQGRLDSDDDGGDGNDDAMDDDEDDDAPLKTFT